MGFAEDGSVPASDCGMNDAVVHPDGWLRNGPYDTCPHSQSEVLREWNREKFIRRAFYPPSRQSSLQKRGLLSRKVPSFRDFLLAANREASGTDRVDVR